MMENLLNSEIKERIRWFDENYADIKQRVAAAAARAGRSADDIRLLAATKTVPVEVINHAIEQGISLIGENRVQELCAKFDDLDKTAERHFIGRLQTNKVKQVVGKVSLIQSVDSVKLAEMISKRSEALGITTDILVEINIGDEESKSGIRAAEAEQFLEKISGFNAIRVKGLMAIPPICEKESDIREYFAQMYKLFIDFSGKRIDNISMDFLSMGMSEDFEQAIEAGANIIRLGTALFGQRNYT